MDHPSIIPEIICSKCGGKNIIIPCNEPGVKYRCLDCGHEKGHDPWERIQANKYWIKTRRDETKIKF